jgi:hypothetical protein
LGALARTYPNDAAVRELLMACEKGLAEKARQSKINGENNAGSRASLKLFRRV